jgi:hypothetical protein
MTGIIEFGDVGPYSPAKVIMAEIERAKALDVSAEDKKRAIKELKEMLR